MAKSFEAVEIISLISARKILDNWDNIHFDNPKRLNLKNEKEKLKNYILRNKSNKTTGKIPTTYHYTFGKKDKSRQTVNGQGLQNLMRPIRQTISHEYYNDIDMVNSQPTILLNYCKMANYNHTGIEYYINHRDECCKSLMDKYKINKDDAKKAIIRVINGDKPKDYKLQWYIDFCKDIESFHKILETNPEYIVRLSKINEKKKRNELGSLTSEILHDIENRILIQCIAFLKHEKISIDKIVLVYDGFMLPKKDCSISEGLLNRLSQWILDKTKYSVQYIVKPMNEIIDLNGFEIDESVDLISKKHIANTDNDASNILLDTLSEQCYFCDGQIWLRTQCDRIFTNDENIITNELINRCMLLDIEKNDKHKYYSANLAGCKSIVITAINKIKTNANYRDESFVDRMIAYTRDKIFFRNGYIEMVDSEIRMHYEEDYNDYSIITPIRIAYDLPTSTMNYDEDVMNELIDRVMMPIFGSEDFMNNYLEHVARAITGHIEDKDWLILSGMRNCGKGVLTLLNKNTWGAYSNETSANSFLIEKSHTAEDPKKYAWLGSNRWTRLLFTSEVKFDVEDRSLKIDGNLIKNKLSSGGDVIEVRDLYKSAIRIKPQSRLFMMCNDIPPITPPDATQTLSKFNFPSQFLDKDVYETRREEGTLNKNTKLKDLDIKDYVINQDVSYCYMMMVLNKYTTQKVRNCQKVIDDTNSIKADMGDETEVIRSMFNFTGSKKDYILSNELNDFYQKNHFHISINKLKEILVFNGAVYDKHLGDNNTQRGYSCIRIKEVEKP